MMHYTSIAPRLASVTHSLGVTAWACAAALVSLVVACGGGGGKPAVTTAAICSATPDEAQVLVSSSDLVEASGIASSRLDDNLFWAHNDSGDTARVFAFDREGFHHARYALPGAEAIDWEDMAIGPGPEDGASYLYLADIGDNAAVRPEIVVYRMAEPQVALQSDTPTDNAVAEFDTLTLRYPDHPHDAETLLVDPIDGDLVIVTKELQTNRSLVFRAPPSFDTGAEMTLEQVAGIDFTQLTSAVQPPPDASPLVLGVPRLPTGGDVSPDGRLVAIRTYSAIWVWARDPDQPLWTAFAAAPCEAPSAIEAQGEAIAFDPDGRGYITVSEGAFPPLHHFAVQ